MKIILPILVAVSSLFSYDSYIDCQFTADPYDPRGQTHIDITAPHVFYHEGGSVVLTPEVTSYVNSNTDIGFSVAKKHELFGYTWGTHLFYDRSSLPGATFHHMGHGWSFASDSFEITANYYHPLTKTSYQMGTHAVGPKGSPTKFIIPCKWVDSEFLLKTPNFSVGTGPIYNVNFKEFALHSRLIIPTANCTFSLGGMLSESGFAEAFLSISFSLMKNPSSSLLSTPISRTKKCSIAYQSLSPYRAHLLDSYNAQIEQLITLPKNLDGIR